ncbi:MAG: 2-dehydropantoate 2-reductase N-terminal domain-containing protein [Methanotrichaceae archaeon]|jgi:2-dehydropantoate 2-reductase
MKTDNARILVIGAGVNGSVCACFLQQGGVDVTLLARGKRYDDIWKEGIIIEDPFTNQRSVTRVKVNNALRPDDIYDYILVVIRSNQVPALLPVLVRNNSPNVVFMGNNLPGPGDYVMALGKGRVMMGAVFAGGKRDGDVIRAMIVTSIASPFGEIDGAVTPRLKRLVKIFNQAGLKAKASTEIVDFTLTHAAGVPLFGVLTMKYKCDTRALAKSADLGLLVDAMREANSVLRALGYRTVPKSWRLIEFIPRFILVALFRFFLSTKLAEVGGAYHVSQAPDEMLYLAKELEKMVDKSGLPAPAIRKVLSMS